MAWRNCYASGKLLEAVNAKWPARDRTSDGAIGDASHATRSSDHNPWVKIGTMGIVRARDFDVDGINAAWIAEELRKMGAKGDPRLAGGGYIIYNRRITASNFASWKTYTGINPHTQHFHVSFSLNRVGYDSTSPWQLGTIVTPVPVGPASLPTLRLGMKNNSVAHLQAFSNAFGWKPVLPLLKVDGDFGAKTKAVMAAAQKQMGVTGPDAIGDPIGPRTNSALWNRGYRG